MTRLLVTSVEALSDMATNVGVREAVASTFPKDARLIWEKTDPVDASVHQLWESADWKQHAEARLDVWREGGGYAARMVLV